MQWVATIQLLTLDGILTGLPTADISRGGRFNGAVTLRGVCAELAFSVSPRDFDAIAVRFIRAPLNRLAFVGMREFRPRLLQLPFTQELLLYRRAGGLPARGRCCSG